jgi:hypothetical protein
LSTPFSRTLRALDADRGLGGLLMATGAGLLLCWGLWLGLARVTVYADSEAARVESIGSRDMAGVAKNLYAYQDANYRERGYHLISAMEETQIGDAVGLYIREKLTGMPCPPSGRPMLEEWREHLDEKIGGRVEELQGAIDDQASFGLAGHHRALVGLWRGRGLHGPTGEGGLHAAFHGIQVKVAGGDEHCPLGSVPLLIIGPDGARGRRFQHLDLADRQARREALAL